MNSDYLDDYPGQFQYDMYNHGALGLSYTFNRGSGNVKMVPEETKELPVYIPQDADEPLMPENKKENDSQGFNRVIDVLEIDYNKPDEIDTVPEVKVIEEKPVKYIPADNGGIEYRVQIRARYVAKTYHFSADEIKESSHKGYFIYSVGSYDSYNQAAERRNTIRSKNGVYDAFVVAFIVC